MTNKSKKKVSKLCVLEECPFNKLMKSNFIKILIDTTSKNIPMLKIAALREDEKEIKIAFIDILELMINEYNKNYKNNLYL